MGRKTKTKTTQVVEESDDDNQEFEINLKALDGYDLPNSEDEEEDPDFEVRTEKPKKKKMKKESRPRALGFDYRQREEQRLEELLFGELLQKFEIKTQEVEAAPIPDIKRSKGKGNKQKQVSTETSSSVLPEDKYGNRLGIPSVTDKKAAWIDEDDLTLELKDVVAGYKKAPGKHGSKETSTTNYKQYLEKNFVSVHGQATPKWAQLTNDGSKKKADALENLTKTATDLLVKDSLLLPPTIIEVKRVTDLNKESRAEGAGIKATEFHKKQSVALVAGNSGVATLFRVGGFKNEKIQSIRFNQFPIHRAHFSADGEEFLALSNMSGNIQVHNIVTGKSRILPHNKDVEKGIFKNFVMSPDGNLIAFQGRFGYIHLMSARSKEWVSSLKTNGAVHALTFNSDGTRLYSHGEFGEVHVWDMNSRNCVHKFVDDGCIVGTSIAVSPTQQYLACGSSSGVVNLYDTSKLENCSLPKPDKILLNLVTQISGINFHPNSELMSMYSTEKKNAIRMVHFPSLTVFKNFPMAGKETPQINCLDFSPNGGYFSLGLTNGSAQLYRLHHYDQY